MSKDLFLSEDDRRWAEYNARFKQRLQAYEDAEARVAAAVAELPRIREDFPDWMKDKSHD